MGDLFNDYYDLENKLKWTERNLKNGRFHGIQKIWHKSGQLYFVATSKINFSHGIQIRFNFDIINKNITRTTGS